MAPQKGLGKVTEKKYSNPDRESFVAVAQTRLKDAELE